MRRIGLVLAIGLLAVVAVVVYFVNFRLDGVVRSAIERHGSEVTGTAVRVKGVDIDLRAGRGTIRGVTVANPPGYSSAPALSLSEITIDLEPTSVRSSPIAIDEIHVGEPVVNVEFGADGMLNVDQLRKNIDAYDEREPAATPDTALETRSGVTRSETRLRVREISFSEGRIRIDPQAIGREPEELRLAAISLREVGEERGVTPAQLGEEVADALVARTLVAVAGSQAKRALKDLGGELGEKLGELLERGIQR
jgi:uncharacterized protein involved in outer membrane biogenesis